MQHGRSLPRLGRTATIPTILLATFVTLALATTAWATAATTTLVSVSSDGVQGDRHSFPHSNASSEDGHLITFDSKSTNLVPNDTNGFNDVFVRDLTSGETTRVSVSSDGEQSDSSSTDATISSDGSTVAFTSAARNLVAGDTN